MQQMLVFLQLVALLEIATGDPPRLPAPNANLNIYALPVGQGDCTIIQCPQGTGGVYIIDIGSKTKNTGMKEGEVAEYLRGQSIGAVILTHSDEDHVNYLNAVLAPLKETEYPTVYHSCEWDYDYQKHFTEEVRAKLKTKRIKDCCGRNDCLQKVQIPPICNGQVPVTLNILGSGQDGCKTESNKNGDSVVTSITYGNIRTLVVGDFEGEQDIISKFITCTGGSGITSELRSQLYRLSHHGADNEKANTVPFLQAVGSPQYVFSSSGLHGQYKHPRCSLKTYYTGKTRTVGSHAYTCYDKDAGIWDNSETTTGIYVATTLDTEGNTRNYIIQFAVDDSGNITPSLTEV